MSNNLTSRLDRLESIMGPPVPPSAWAGFDQHAQAAMTFVGLYAARTPVGGEPWPYRSSDPRAVAAAEAAVSDIQSRLDREGLLVGPLDDVQVERIGEIRDAVLAELGPDPSSPFAMVEP